MAMKKQIIMYGATDFNIQSLEKNDTLKSGTRFITIYVWEITVGVSFSSLS